MKCAAETLERFECCLNGSKIVKSHSKTNDLERSKNSKSSIDVRAYGKHNKDTIIRVLLSPSVSEKDLDNVAAVCAYEIRFELSGAAIDFLCSYYGLRSETLLFRVNYVNAVKV